MLTTQMAAAFIMTAGLLSFGLFTPHFITWILFAEIFGIGLFLFFAIACASLDSLTLAIGALFTLCLATSESAMGLGLLIFNFVKTGSVHGYSTTQTRS